MVQLVTRGCLVRNLNSKRKKMASSLLDFFDHVFNTASIFGHKGDRHDIFIGVRFIARASKKCFPYLNTDISAYAGCSKTKIIKCFLHFLISFFVVEIRTEQIPQQRFGNQKYAGQYLRGSGWNEWCWGGKELDPYEPSVEE